MRFDASGEIIRCVNSTPTFSVQTIIVIFRPIPGASVASRLISKFGNRELLHATNVNVMQTFITRNTTNAIATSAFSNFANYPGTNWSGATSSWLFAAGQIEPDVVANCRLFIGNAARPPEEPDTYSVKDGGSGTITGDAGEGMVVGNNLGEARESNADIYFAGVWPRILSRGELHGQWRAWIDGSWRIMPGAYFLMFPGLTGTGTQIDWSGYGAHGTVTNATVAPAPPDFWRFQDRRRKVGKAPAVGGTRFLLTRF